MIIKAYGFAVANEHDGISIERI